MGIFDSKQTVKTKPWQPAVPYIREGMGDAADLYRAGGFQINPYSGQMVAGYDPYRAQADAGAGGVYNASLAAARQSQQALGQAMNPNAQAAGLRGMIDNTIADVMPGINSSFAGSGMTGSGLHAQNLAKGLASGVAGVRNDFYQSAQNRALAAAGMVPGANAAMQQATGYLSGVGQQRQAYDQSQISADMLQNQQRQQAPMQAIQDYLAMMSGIGMGGGSTRQNNGGGIMNMANLAGGALQAAPLVAGLFGSGGAAGAASALAPLLLPFSDRRLKEDVKRVGKTDDGLNVYTYRYKDEPTFHMGVMAQELVKVKPEAVGQRDGYMTVNYGAL